MTVNKAISRHRAVRQRRAVVLLAVGSRGQLHRARADRQRSRFRFYLKLRCYVVVQRIFYYSFTAYIKGGFAVHVGLRCRGFQSGNSILLPIHRKRHRIKAGHGQSFSVILLISGFSFQHNNILLCTICDLQRSVLRLNRVVVRVRVAVQLVGELVIARANNRLASRHLVRRAFAVSKATARYRHFVLRQRCAVVGLAGRTGGQRHRARADRQAAVIRRRNFIFLRLIYLANRTFRKLCRIGVSILSRRANRDIAEISLFRRSGKAGNSMLVSIISLRVAVRRQLDVLIIVEIDYVIGRVSLNRDRLIGIRFRRNCAVVNIGGGFRHRSIERLAVNGLGFRDRLGRPVPVVIHRVAQVGSLTINNRHSPIFGQRSCHNGLIRRITGDVRRCYRVLCAMV